MKHRITSLLSLCLLACLSGVATGQPVGRFFAALDENQSASFGTTQRSVVFFDLDALEAGTATGPMFSVFLGLEGGGSNEEADAITVDPLTGDVYALTFDSGLSTGPAELELSGDLDGVGDFDLYRINFQAAYNDWVTNQGMANTTYYNDVSALGTHPNPVNLPASIEKVGEVARSGSFGADPAFFDEHLEFVNPAKLILLDNETDSATDDYTVDHEIRAITRVSASSGAATDDGAANGGFNNGTTESWESTIIGRVQLDGATAGSGRSEPTSIAYVERDGVEGIWITDRDFVDVNPDPLIDDFQPAGDDLAFFEITDYTSTTGNGYKEMAVGPGSPFGRTFQLDDDPVTNSSSNDGVAANVFVDSDGNLVIVESGFDDTPRDEPGVISREVNTYDLPDSDASSENEIDFGAWDYEQLDTSSLPDDDSPARTTEARYSFFDPIARKVYFFQEDNSSTTGTPFSHDVYSLELGAINGSTGDGVSDLTGADIITSLSIFSDPGNKPSDNLEFFQLSVPGDFDIDGDKDDLDIDRYIEELQKPVLEQNRAFDLNNDDVITADDYVFHAQNLLEWANAGNGQSGMGTLRGDFNRDGTVDLIDLDRLGASWQSNVGWNNGDTNGDGIVDLLDLDRLGQNWGQDVFVAPSAAPAAPEPASLMLLGLGGLALARRRR